MRDESLRLEPGGPSSLATWLGAAAGRGGDADDADARGGGDESSRVRSRRWLRRLWKAHTPPWIREISVS